MGVRETLACLVTLAAFVGESLAQSAKDNDQKKFDAVVRVEVKTQEISIDRVLAYVAPYGDFKDTEVFLVHDAKDEQGHMPSTVIELRRIFGGQWLATQIVALAPYGWTGNLGSLKWIDEKASFICESETFVAKPEQAKAIEDALRLKWKSRPEYDQRWCSHCRSIGFLKISETDTERQTFLFFLDESEMQNDPYEIIFATLAEQFSGGAYNACSNPPHTMFPVTVIPRNPALEREFTKAIQAARVESGLPEIPMEYLSE